MSRHRKKLVLKGGMLLAVLDARRPTHEADLSISASAIPSRAAKSATPRWSTISTSRWVGMGRYVLNFRGVAYAKSSEVIDWLAHVLQGYLTGKLV